MNKKYIISGIGVGDTGTSKFLEKLLEYNKSYTVITPGKHVKVKTLLKKREFFRLAGGLIYYVLNMVLFKCRCFVIKNSEVILLHPQTIGLKTTIRLVNCNAKIKYYVLDNFLFCKQSYNFNKNTRGECIKCIHDTADKECFSFPVRYSNKTYNAFRNCVIYSEKIEFYFQNSNHLLLHKKISSALPATVIGLETSELEASEITPIESRGNYIVFHGDLIDAKGFDLLNMLIAGLPEILFIIPDIDERLSGFDNVKMECARWDTGLSEQVKNAKLVLCLSSWSAPIETALTKSIRSNGVVVTGDVEYGFSAEFTDAALLKISLDDEIVSLSKVRRLFESQTMQRAAIINANAQLVTLNKESIYKML
jgi:hypothetical protein